MNFKFGNTNSRYIYDCIENAKRKFDMELDLLYTKNVTLPITVNDCSSRLCFSTLPGSMESYYTIMEWIRNLREKEIYNNTVLNNSNTVTAHDAFISMYALNSLRIHKIPNFLYYHAVIENRSTSSPKLLNFITLNEYNFNNPEDEEWYTFEDVCRSENYEVILAYYLSILLALYNANLEFSYTNYELIPKNILMKPFKNKIFDVEYGFENESLWITNYGCVPIIANNDKSYVKVMADGKLRSFGYNNVDAIPFEDKGIFTDRGFVITDAYRLLMSIYEITYNENPEAYNMLKYIFNFFNKDEPKNFLKKNHFLDKNHFLKNEALELKNLIKYIIKLYPDCVSKKPSNDVLRCIGNSLEIKSSSFDYYIAKNVVQMYDFLKFHFNFMNDKNKNVIQKVINDGVDTYGKFFENESLTKEKNRQQDIRDVLYEHNTLYEVTDNPKIFENSKYIKQLVTYLNISVVYVNEWERAKFYSKIFNFIKDVNEEYVLLYEDYSKMIQDNQVYYDLLFETLIKIRNMFRENLNLYSKFSKQILFLETLD